MASQDILREYLVALGFKVNETQERRMNTSLDHMDKKVFSLGKKAVAAATAVVAITTAVARSWEKMFFAARYADTTVEKMQSIEFGARNIGLEAGRMSGAVKAFAVAIRGNPGLQGLLESLGVEVKGRTKDDVLLDFVKTLREMPPYIAQRFAAMFGMDPETLFNLEAGLEDMKKARELREQMNRDAGLDAEGVAKIGHEYMNLWRQVEARASVFGTVLMKSVLPVVQDLVSETDKLLIKWTQIIRDIEQAGTKDFWQRIREGITGKAEGDRVSLNEAARARIGAPKRDEPAPRVGGPGSSGDVLTGFDQYMRWRDSHGAVARDYDMREATDPRAVDAVQDMDSFKRGGKGGPMPAPSGAYTKWAQRNQVNPLDPATAAMFAELEKKYDLPPGLMDRVYVAESSRGRNVVSPKGALGPFQFMPATAREYALKDPFDLKQSAEAAAHKYHDLITQYGGDVEMAAAGYNWGQGNLENVGLGRMPQETRDYVQQVAGGMTLQQDVNIHVHGSSDPNETASAVAREQKGVGRDLVRNFSTKVR